MEISVIVPSYNYGRFLADAIHSLIGGQTSLGDFAPQTFQDFEIIIVDDASADETGEVAHQIMIDDARVMLDRARIEYIRNPENLGTAGALNVGIRSAQGEFITFMSADDMMESTRLEKMHHVAKSSPHRIVYDDLMMFAKGQRTLPMRMSPYDFDKLLYKNTMHAGIMYPRSAWEETGGYPEAFRDGREDWAFNVVLGKFGYCGIHVAEPLYLYRWENQNRSLRNAGVDWRITFLNKMQATYPDLYRGERGKMCCGNKRSAPAQQGIQRARASRGSSSRAVSTPMSPDVIVGAEGMTALEYQLTKAGPAVYRGAVTGQTYVFGGKHKIGLVDNRDVPGLISRIEDRRHAFAYAPGVIATDMRAPEVKATSDTYKLVTEPIKEETVTIPVEASEEQKPKRKAKAKGV